MSKKRIFAIVALILCIAAFLTNPKEEEHEAAVRDKAKEILKKQLDYKNQDAIDFGMTLFGDNLIDQFMQNSVRVKNYYFFSLTSIAWQGKETVVGLGAFNHIWLSKKIDEKADEIIAVIKNM